MKYFVFTIAMTIVLGGCSASNVEKNATANAANPNAANANGIAATNSNPAGMQPINGAQNINPNAFNASGDNLKVIKYQPKKDELPYGSRSAPDESVITSGSRGTEFFETRTFKNHPVVAKVEKIMDGKTTKYKIFLKNGKTVEAPAEKMTNMAAMSPENILDAVGMLPKAPTAPPVNSEKKEEKQQ